MNWYAYVGNNPVVGIDPSGLFPFSEAPIFGYAEELRRQAEADQARIGWALSALETLGYFQEAAQLRGRVAVVAWLPGGAAGLTNPITGTVYIPRGELAQDDLLLSDLVHEAQHQYDLFVKRRGPTYTHAHPNGREDSVIDDYGSAVASGKLVPYSPCPQ